jgi:uncharacterized protein YjiS (DUF1127 family)
MCVMQPIAVTGQAVAKVAGGLSPGAPAPVQVQAHTHNHAQGHAHGHGHDHPAASAPGSGYGSAGSGLLRRFFDWLAVLHERRLQRQALARLDVAALMDIGLSAADVDREIERLCWRRWR